MLDKNPDTRAGIYDIIRDAWVTDQGESMVDLDLTSATDTEDSF